MQCISSLTSFFQWNEAPSIKTAIQNYRVDTISSIFRIMRTHSVAKDSALVLTSIGCTTFSSKILVICPFLTLMPVFTWNNHMIHVSSSSRQTWKCNSCPRGIWARLPGNTNANKQTYLAVGMSVTKLRYNSYWVQTSILRQCEWNHLHSNDIETSQTTTG